MSSKNLNCEKVKEITVKYESNKEEKFTKDSSPTKAKPENIKDALGRIVKVTGFEGDYDHVGKILTVDSTTNKVMISFQNEDDTYDDDTESFDFNSDRIRWDYQEAGKRRRSTKRKSKRTKRKQKRNTKRRASHRRRR